MRTGFGAWRNASIGLRASRLREFGEIEIQRVASFLNEHRTRT